MTEATITIRTAPRDKRFPTVNQTKHCWARYLEFHACAKAKGEDDPECEKFKRWYGSLCPIEWVRAVAAARCVADIARGVFLLFTTVIRVPR